MELKMTSQQSRGSHWMTLACIISNLLLQLEISFAVILWQLWCKTDSDEEFQKAGKVAQPAWAPTTKPNDLSVLSGTHMIEGEHHLPQVVL